jgi:hypothetical protein
MKEYYPKNAQRMRAKYRKYYIKNRERVRASSREKFRKLSYKLKERARLHRYTAKRKARRLLRSAIDQGQIKRPSKCSRCGRRGPVHGHHADYSKPLSVEWLCTLCHGEIHRKDNDA